MTSSVFWSRHELASLASGDAVFLDANVFVYDFAPDPAFGPPSKALLNRETGDLAGYISATVFNDVAYRLMTLEACQLFGWPYAGIGQRLARHPADMHRLVKSRQALDEIMRIGIQVLPVNAQDVLLAGDLSRRHGLLSGDALVVALMQCNGLTNLASNDADLDRVPGITRLGPV
jgi:predicted nucleic acid-binding protein